MPLVTICFDQVFDLVPSTSKRKEVTFFNFISGTSHQYAVPAPGKPTIEAGMVVTAYLSEDANWQTLVGWKNHSSNEVVVESGAYEAFFLGCLGLLLILLFYISPQIVIFGICLLGIVWGGAWALTSILRIRRIESILRSTQRP